MNIKNANKMPQYLLIAETIRSWIASGRYKVGDSIATTGELAEQFGVARGTINEALRELSSQGVILTSRGKKSTVNSSPLIRPVLAKMKLGDQIFIEKTSDEQKKLVSVSTVTAGEPMLASLDFHIENALIQIEFCNYLNDRRNAYGLYYIADFLNGEASLDETDLILEQLRKIKNSATQNETRFSAMVADIELSRNLEINVGSPVIRYRNLISSGRSNLDLYCEAFLRSDDCEYQF